MKKYLVTDYLLQRFDSILQKKYILLYLAGRAKSLYIRQLEENGYIYTHDVPVNFQFAEVVNISIPRHELIKKVVEHMVNEATPLKLCKTTFI